MVAQIESCVLLGLEPYPVVCEVDLSLQLPQFVMVGLPSSITQESRERVKAAFVNSGLDWPQRKVTVSLLPAALPKWGSHFELAIALGVAWAHSGEPQTVSVFALGELSLSGDVRPCGWVGAIANWLAAQADHAQRNGIPIVVMAHDRDVQDLLLAQPDLKDLCELIGVRTLVEAVTQLSEVTSRMKRAQNQAQTRAKLRVYDSSVSSADPLPPSFSTLKEVRGEPLAKLAALVAIAGGHHCLFAGPQGIGKSMLIRAITEATASLTPAEQVERSSIFKGLGGVFDSQESESCGGRPVVSLQTSATRAALEGALQSSGQVLPGELTRAHRGILVADEFLEFKRDVIECLRQPLEEGIVRLQRARFRATLPASFQLLASTNLCPCGKWSFGTSNSCRCAAPRRISYQSKLSGPILDRFDLTVLLGEERLGFLEKMPPDLKKLTIELLDPSTWEVRLREFPHVPKASLADPAELWSQVSTGASERGKLKLARVSRTLAGLLGVPRQVIHLRLAVHLRQNLEDVLRHGVQGPPKFLIKSDGLQNVLNI